MNEITSSARIFPLSHVFAVYLIADANAHHGLGAVIMGNSIYVISGGPESGATFSPVVEVFTP